MGLSYRSWGFYTLTSVWSQNPKLTLKTPWERSLRGFDQIFSFFKANGHNLSFYEARADIS